MVIESGGANNYAYVANTNYNVDNIILEVGFTVSSFSSQNGLRICASNGTNGPQIATPSGILCFLDSTASASYTKAANLSANTHYVIKIIRSSTTSPRIYLDGERVNLLSVDNSSFQYSSGTRIWSQGQGGSVTVDSIKVKILQN